MVSFTVGLSHAQYMHVSQRAEREGKSVNQIIQEIVEQEMTKGDKK
jgi:predicted HicB family RNase H-like nuclease